MSTTQTKALLILFLGQLPCDVIPCRADQLAINKKCSEDADQLGLHGQPRFDFREKCKRLGANTQTAPAIAPQVSTSQTTAPEPRPVATAETQTAPSSADLEYSVTIQSCHEGRNDYRIAIRDVIPNHDLFPQLVDTDKVKTLLAAVSADVLAKCAAKAAQLDSDGRLHPLIGAEIEIGAPPPWDVLRRGGNIIDADWDRATNDFRITSNRVRLVLNEYDDLQRKQTEEEAAKAVEAKKKIDEAEQREKRKSAAYADCGTAPAITGGPWFSFTYKVGATDEAQRLVHSGQLFCIKTVEYMSPAVNPMGGNAARAIFAGYNGQTFDPLRVIADFPY